MSSVEDPRKTGINRVLISDRNGGELDVYTMTAQRFRVWGGVVIAVFTICGMVFAAARFGVGVEVHQAIEEEATLETGAIHREIHRCTEEYMDEIVEVIQEDMEIFDEQLSVQHDLGIRLEERQIAMGNKVVAISTKADAQHRAVMQAIRDAGGNS
jgi:hypothetical protein